jgi:hypothetical protein
MKKLFLSIVVSFSVLWQLFPIWVSSADFEAEINKFKITILPKEIESGTSINIKVS